MLLFAFYILHIVESLGQCEMSLCFITGYTLPSDKVSIALHYSFTTYMVSVVLLLLQIL